MSRTDVDDGSRPFAALDVGSNTIRLLVASPRNGDLEVIGEDSRFVRLGHGVDTCGEIQADRQEAALKAIAELAAQARDRGAETVRAVATSAVRDARNGGEFAGRVATETGITLEILSGDEEGRLTFLGATLHLDLARGALVADVGGGSSEIIDAGPDGVRWARSLKVGSGRLTDRFIRGDPPSRRERAEVLEYVALELGRLPPPDGALAVFTGGTASNMAMLAVGSQDLITRLAVEDLKRVEALAYTVPAATLTREYGVRPERAAVFAAGATIVDAIARWSGAPDVAVTRQGIREGVIVDTLARSGG